MGTQAGIKPQGGSMIYRWKADAGTHFYHAHMQALQADRGLKGPIVVHAKQDPHASMYQEEKVITLSDEWQDPGACLKAEGAQPGNPVCMEIEKATWCGVTALRSIHGPNSQWNKANATVSGSSA